MSCSAGENALPRIKRLQISAVSPDDEKDHGDSHKLIDGCVDWTRTGLGPTTTSTSPMRTSTVTSSTIRTPPTSRLRWSISRIVVVGLKRSSYVVYPQQGFPKPDSPRLRCFVARPDGCSRACLAQSRGQPCREAKAGRCPRRGTNVFPEQRVAQNPGYPRTC